MKRQWKTGLLLLSTAVMVMVLGAGWLGHGTATAANPTTISFQGKVVNSNGTNVTDGTYTFVFKLYTVSSAGTAVWTETDSLAVANGIFQVNLGTNCSFFTANACNNNTPIDFNANPALYLGMTFNGDVAGEMTPRVQMQSVPFAYNADKVGGLSASQLVQLSPGTAQTGFINVNGNVTSGAVIQGVTVVTGALNATSSGGTVTTNLGTLQRTATGTTNIDLKDAAATTLQLLNSGASVANFNLYGGDLQTGTTPVSRLTNAGALTNITGYTQSSGSAAYTLAAGNSVSLTGSGAARTADMFSIANAIGQEPTTDGVNAAQLTWYAKPATGNMSSGERINVSNKNTATAGQVQGMRIIATGAGGAINSDTVGLYIDPLTSSSTGTASENAIEIGTGWDNVLSYNGTGLITGTGAIANLTGFTQASGNALFNVGAANSVSLTATGAARTADILSIGNVAGQEPTIDGINGQQVTWFAKPTTGNFSSASRLNVTNKNTTTAGQVQGMRIVATGAGGAINSDTVGLYIDPLTGSSTGTAGENAIEIGTGWDNALQTAGFSVNGSATPLLSASSSLVRIGNAITTGDAAGGTYLGINLPASGNGSASDFAEFESNGTTKFNIDKNGTTTMTGALTGGYVADTAHATETALNTYANANPGTNFYISTNVATNANASFATTINLTGLPAVDGTFAFITIVANKQATTANITHSTTVQIATTTVGTATTVTGTGAATPVTHSFAVARMNGIWRIVGTGGVQGAVAANASTATTADFAEWIRYSGVEKPQPGEVLTVGNEGASAKKSGKSYDTAALGVVSTDPYQIGGTDDGHSVILALTGRVPVKVNLEGGAIHKGDKLTSSSVTGVAMKATRAGHIIGTALTDYDGQGDAEVTVQLQPGYDDPTGGSIMTPAMTQSGSLRVDAGTNGVMALDTSDENSSVNIGAELASGVNLSRIGKTTTVKGGLRVDQGSSFGGDVGMDFSGSDSLHITTDLKGNATGFIVTATPSATAGEATGVSIKQAESDNTNGLDTALHIDNGNSHLAIDNAIQITNSGGAGYNKLINTPGFNVSGNGDVNTNGTVSAHGFQLVDASGKQTIAFDGSGNASFNNLNLASASISGGLNVGGDLNVAGLSNFQKLATFLGKTLFKQDVEFQGHITVASDGAGYASLRKGETSVHVSFTKPYDAAPVVTATITNGQFADYTVDKIDAKGFDIKLHDAAGADTSFNWTAVGVNTPQTASNPQPLATAKN